MEIEVGSTYRVDHSNFPKLNQLITTQVVVVSRKSGEEVTVKFPSKKSLEKFFCGEKISGLLQPSLDEEFVVSSKLCRKILTRKIASDEFAAQRCNRQFWVSSDDKKERRDDDNADDHDDDGDKISSSVELGVKWETRKRTKVYTRRKCRQKIKVDDTDGDRKAVDSNEVCREDKNVVLNSKEDEDEDEEKEKEEEKKDEEIKAKGRSVGKRKCQFKGVSYRDKRKRRKPTDQTVSQKKFIDTQHRWTVERYKLAEMNMLKIMKEKGAGPNNPILRPVLRAEARKLIGDTGLLDHLLKHMAGKLAPGGKERFCRRHNPEGAMEYWMESADLLHVRKREGIDDPFWVPPPGWKPGDCPTNDPVCASQLKELRDEISSMKREIGNLSSRRGQESSEVPDADAAKYVKTTERLNFEESVMTPLREMYDEVMMKKAKVEKELLNICRSFSGMEEEIERLKEAAASSETMSQNAGTQTSEMPAAAAYDTKDAGRDGAGDVTIAAAAEKEEMVAKSGFKMCRPQGTFRWPSQQPASSSQYSQLLLSPLNVTPHHLQPRRLPPVAKPVATRAGVTLSFSTATVRGSTTIHSIESPTASTSTSVHYFIPDLNQSPFYSLPPLHQ